MAKLSIAELETAIASYVDANKISATSFTASVSSIAGLVDKIGKIITLDTSFVDKLSMFNGEEMRFGKTIEEWQMDLTLPIDYDRDGENALAPYDPTFRPVDYSYSLGRKVIATTIRNNEFERAVNNESQYISLVSMITKRLMDSVASWKYACKREMLGKLIALCEGASSSATTFGKDTAYSVGNYVKSSGEVAVVVKPIKASSDTTFAERKADGSIIVLDLVETLAQPVDTSSGEAFVKSVKEAVEQAQDISEGHSLNGNTLGASQGLVLLVKQGLIPTLEVDVLAGAFHEQKVAVPAEIVVIKDFGSDASGVYAVLMDKRGMALYNSYRSTKEQINAKGDFVNIFYHTEDTAHLSRNTFVKVYKAS